MCMLGHSIFATGAIDELVEILQDFGNVYTTSIDMSGARIINNNES